MTKDRRAGGRIGLMGILVLFLFLSALLSGCDRWAGHAEYEVIYPSGWSRDGRMWEDEVPVEGTSLMLRRIKAEDYEENRAFDLCLLDQEGKLLYTCPGLAYDTMRGEAGEEGTVWLCSESWSASHYNGYMDGSLTKGALMLVDVSEGRALFWAETEKNEFYLTSVGGRCYFYTPGRESRKILFGLVKLPEEKARIYYRDRYDWEQKNTVHTMNYAEFPRVEGKDVDRLQFWLESDAIRIVLADYEQTDREANTWEYVEKDSVGIPLPTPTSKGGRLL